MSNRKAIYFTSDQHFGHANSIKFDNRPFRDLDHMHRVLINNYNAVVPENGLCYILGDFGMMSAEELKEIVSQLNGTKVLVLGNHDRNHNAMYNIGFDVVVNAIDLYIAGERVTMTHCPLRGIKREDVTGMRGAVEGDNWHGESKQLRFSVENQGQFHLSGHIHSPNGGKSTRIQHRQMDVGVVGNNYTPIHISKIESWIAVTKKKESGLVDVVGFPGYKVNVFGEVFSYKRYKMGRKLKHHTDKDGYIIQAMMLDGKNKKEKVHRIVAKAFLNNQDNLPQVNHKNGHKWDNTPSNLEWCSNIKNQQHAWDSDLKTIKLTTKDVVLIKEMIYNGDKNCDIAPRFDVDPSTISNIRHGKIWNRKKDEK